MGPEDWWPSPTLRGAVEPVIESLMNSPWVDVQKRKYYTIVKLKPTFFLKDRKKLLRSLQQHPFSLDTALKEHYFSESTLTEVGLIKSGRLFSTKRAGILLYGPYIGMAKGHYHFVLYGSASNASGGCVYIISAHNRIPQTQFPFQRIKHVKGVLTSGDFTLNKSISDLEIRILAAKETKVQIKGYKLIRVSSIAPLTYRDSLHD